MTQGKDAIGAKLFLTFNRTQATETFLVDFFVMWARK